MHVCRLTALVASIGLAAGQGSPCDVPSPPGSPCDVPTPPPPTPAPSPPTPAPYQPPAPTPPPPSSKETEVCKLPTPTGAFTPWYTYKYLKASTVYVETESKDLMGGQTMNILNADKPISATRFSCVAQDGEWKARVKSPLDNILTMEIDTGMDYVLKGGPPDGDISQRCLLQDISLYRTKDGIPGLRLDYGHCTKPKGQEQAFIMLGLKKVRDGTVTPNLRGFFEEICYVEPTPTTAPKSPCDVTVPTMPPTMPPTIPNITIPAVLPTMPVVPTMPPQPTTIAISAPTAPVVATTTAAGTTAAPRKLAASTTTAAGTTAAPTTTAMPTAAPVPTAVPTAAPVPTAVPTVAPATVPPATTAAPTNTITGEFLDFTKATGYGSSCFAASADMQKMVSLTNCFQPATAFTFLDGMDEYPLLPVTESDWSWLLSKLPVQDMTVDAYSNPCAPVNHHIRTYGKVIVDRLCVRFGGLSCDNGCGKWCEPAKSNNAPMAPPSGYCYDCEWQEGVYIILATPVALYISYFTFIALSQVKQGWKIQEAPPVTADGRGYMPVMNPSYLHRFRDVKVYPRRILKIGMISGIAVLLCFISINLLDFIITVKILGQVQCIRIFPFQYLFDWKHWMQVQGTYAKHEAYLRDKYSQAPPWFPSTFYPWLSDLNPGFCPYRIFYMLAITWLSIWPLMVTWRNEQLPDVKETIMIEKYVAEDEGGSVGNTQTGAPEGASGAFVTAIQSLGGIRQAGAEQSGASAVFKSQSQALMGGGRGAFA